MTSGLQEVAKITERRIRKSCHSTLEGESVIIKRDFQRQIVARCSNIARRISKLKRRVENVTRQVRVVGEEAQLVVGVKLNSQLFRFGCIVIVGRLRKYAMR